jgi:hypothetical protein
MMTKRWHICWPPVSDLKDIRMIILAACFVVFFYAAIWGLGMLFGSFAILTANSGAIGKTLKALIHFAIATAIGWGMLKKFRIAPVAGLVLSVYGFIVNSVTKGFINSTSIIMAVDVWVFIHATRGIFAYHKITKHTEIEKTAKV